MISKKQINIRSFYGRFLAVIFLFGLFSLVIIGLKRLDPNGQPPDILQDYVVLKALSRSESIYQPFSVLVSKFAKELDFNVQREAPIPHSPFNAIVMSPLSLFTFEGANLAWLIIQCVLILFIGAEIVALSGLSPRWIWIPIISVSIAALSPIRFELREGQINLLPTLLFLHAVSALKGGCLKSSGIWFGASLALKPILWPLALLLALRSRDALLWTAITFLTATELSFTVIHTSDVTSYFMTHAGSPGRTYYNYFANASLITLGARLFEGTFLVPETLSVVSPPLLWQAKHSIYVGLFSCLAAAFYCFNSVRGIKENWRALLVISPLSVLISPVSWVHYGTYLVPLLFVLLIDVTRSDLKKVRLAGLIVFIGFMFLGDPIAYVFSKGEGGASPFWAYVGLFPTFVFIALFSFSSRLYSERVKS